MQLELLLIVLFAFVLIINTSYYFLIWFTLKKPETVQKETDEMPVSVIICSRDHGFELKRKLEKILMQQYTNYEVIVLDDFSTDDTRDILLDLKIQYPYLKPVFLKDLKKDHVSKKDALTTAILFSKYDTLLFTDADCEPVSEYWIKSMIQPYKNPNTEIVLGYGKYEKTKGFLNLLIRWDAFSIALQYFTFARLKLPYMGVGRNISYKKQLFLKNKGFYNHSKIDSGDDDLFIQQNAHGKNTAILYNKDSFTSSTPKYSWRSWFLQKTRHVTTSTHYKFIHKLLLSILAFFKYAEFLLLIFVTIVFIHDIIILQIVYGLYSLKVLFQILFIYRPAKYLGEKDLPKYLLIFEILLLFIYPLFIFGKYFVKHKRT